VKFLLDHDVPDDLKYLLRELNHEVSLRCGRFFRKLHPIQPYSASLTNTAMF
jgi:hypothetical protein